MLNKYLKNIINTTGCTSWDDLAAYINIENISDGEKKNARRFLIKRSVKK
jgi:hypothetical protein